MSACGILYFSVRVEESKFFYIPLSTKISKRIDCVYCLLIHVFFLRYVIAVCFPVASFEHQYFESENVHCFVFVTGSFYNQIP